MSYIPLKINGKELCEIFTPDAVVGMTDAEKESYSIDNQMYPTEVTVESETYSRNAERTADYELLNLLLVNRKAKPSFTWNLLKHDYLKALLLFLNYTYDFKDEEGVITPVEAEPIAVTYVDLIGERTINAYLGQTIRGTLVVYQGTLYVEDLQLSFPER